MPNIYYYKDASGRELAKWPGVSKRKEVVKNGVVSKESRKEGQKQLGLVIDKENLIFYKKDQGFYRFDPKDQSCSEVELSSLPTFERKTDARRREAPVIVQFGGSYFLDGLMTGIEYKKVIDCVQYQNMDRFYALLQYYLLSGGAACNAEEWYRFNYTKFLYPRANLASQRISEFYAAVGNDENRRRFLMSHIKFLLKSTEEELCILIDSTGMPNKCRIPYTRVSNHDGDVNIEFRLIVVVQKSTGLPVYYEMIPGNVVDVSTVSNVMEKLKNLGYNVEYAIGDAAYSCPANIEKLVLGGIDFLTRLNPTYDLYSKSFEKHISELDDPANIVMFHGRMVSIVKFEETIAFDKKTGKEVKGYVYLCRDQNAWHSKSTNFMNSKRFKSMTREEINAELGKYGIFAFVSTKNLSTDEILKEYYMRQGVEQFFDYAKNCADFLPVRNHNVDTLKGHLLLSFIATFFLVLIKNKLKILDSSYVAIPAIFKSELDETAYAELDTQQGTELMIRQEKQMEIYKKSPAVLFAELQFQMADVFQTEIVPSIQVSGATQIYKAYHIGVPEYVKLEGEDHHPVPVYKDGEGNHCSKRIAFTKRSSLTEEQIEEYRKKGDLKKLEALAKKHGILFMEEGNSKKVDDKVAFSTTDAETKVSDNLAGEKPEEHPAPKRRRGRPLGSKNRKTIEREAEDARLAAEGKQSKKPGRGRPKGSKNKPKPDAQSNGSETKLVTKHAADKYPSI